MKEREIYVLANGVSLSHEKNKTRLVITRAARQTGGPALTSCLEVNSCKYKRK